MEFNIKVNNISIKARKGETILQALTNNGMSVPTLCYLKNLNPSGACRMCVVEVEGRPELVTACSNPVEEWMIIKTHSPKVIKARKTIIELLLSNHPDDCLYCERNLNCELQKLSEEHNVRERLFSGRKRSQKKDLSNPAVQYDPSKCILCGRCIRTCDEIQATTSLAFSGKGVSTRVSTCFNMPLNTSNCISCGQCIIVCPTAALYEKRHYPGIQDALSDTDKTLVVIYEPLSAISLSDAFNIKAGKDLNGILNAVLRKIGFDYIFEASFAGDLMLMELAQELRSHKASHGLPLFSSNCPAWVKYAEQFYHDLLPGMSKCKSPQQMLGSLVKRHWAKQMGIDAEKIYTVSLSPCIARKFEGQREENTSLGISEIDAVMTNRELAQFIRLYGIDIANIEAEPADEPFSGHTSASCIISNPGGLTEAVIRSLNSNNKKASAVTKINELRNNKARKEISLTIGKKTMNFVSVSGMANAKKLIEEIIVQPDKYDWVEIMACYQSCANGGGQSFGPDESTIKSRIKSIYDTDDKNSLKVANKNPMLIRLYEEHLGEPGCKKCSELLHTYFSKRKVLI